MPQDTPTALHPLPEEGSRYEAIAHALLEGMVDGRFPVGSLLPTEAELSTEYGVSRQTVRSAMRQLLELGAISRRKGIGTRVEPRGTPAGGFQQALGSLEDLVRYADETRRDIKVIDSVVIDRRQAIDWGCKPGSRWLRIGYLRFPERGTAPIGYTEVYIDERFAGIEARLRDHRGLYSDLIETMYGAVIHEVHQEARAIATQGDAARQLTMADGTIAMEVRRRYLDRSGAMIEFTISTHPADRYSVKTSMKRIA